MSGSAFLSFFLLGAAMGSDSSVVRLDSARMTVEIDGRTGQWALTDKRSGVRWPSAGLAGSGAAKALQGTFAEADVQRGKSVRLRKKNGASVRFALVDGGESLEIRYAGEAVGEVRVLGDALAVADTEGGYAIVPCREGLLIRADSGKSFRRTFGTSEYEGCHMNMLAFAKSGSPLVVTWHDAYTFPEVQSARPRGKAYKQQLTASFLLRRSARSLRLTPLGKGDWNTIAAGYRRLAQARMEGVTLREKVRRNATCERMVGASNVKLWTCLARRMNEASTKEEWVKVRWTFDEAARIAEHLRRDVKIDRCLFILGGWTEGGYDCRHPDNLPANPECGGNKALADAVRRVRKLGYVACLHDNYQDMYRDAKSWDPAYIEKRADGSLIKGGRWLGGRAYMVCAPKQLELAKRPQNLPRIRELFDPGCYFIDTTYAVGPRECHDPNHPIGRNEDILWKQRLSDYARKTFGLFGSECGREWALPHSDFFEGLVAVRGQYFHSLDPARLGATVIPFWEMVYHDCQICYGKYGYAADAAAEYVAHHVLCARPLHYHSIGEHLYWKAQQAGTANVNARPRVVAVDAVGERSFHIRYAWQVGDDVAGDWWVFVHFGTARDILFQDDHGPQPPTSRWRAGPTIEIGPRTVHVPPSLRRKEVNVYIGLYDKKNVGRRAALPGADAQNRVLAGRLVLKPKIAFHPAAGGSGADRSRYTRCDGGWAKGMHPTDVFLKNTHEVLGPLHAATAYDVLTKLEFLTPNRLVRRATYGRGKAATKVVANFSTRDAEVRTALGGKVVLPPWGFVVEGPRLAAFCAKRWGGRAYPDGALFTVQPVGKAGLAGARRVRIFHGFGAAAVTWRGKTVEVPREKIVDVGGSGR